MDQVFLTFWQACLDSYSRFMSENYRFYIQKMAEKHVTRPLNRPLRMQLEDILEVVRECEARWALEDRIDRQLGRG